MQKVGASDTSCNDEVMASPAWAQALEILHRSEGRCTLRQHTTNGPRRLVAIRVREPHFVVKVFKARFDGQVEDFKPVLVCDGTFEEAFTLLAKAAE